MPRRSGALSILVGCRHTDSKIMRPHAALPPAHRKSDTAPFGHSQHPRRMPSHGQQNLAPARRRPAACTLQIRCRAVRALSAPSQDAVTRTTKSCARTPPCRLHTPSLSASRRKTRRPRPYDTAAPVRKPCGSLTGIGRCLRKNSLLFLDYTKKQPEKQLFFKKFRNSTVILRAVEC